MAFQMTPRLQDLDNSQTFYARLYEAFSAWDKDRYSADKARIPQKYQTVRQELALPFARYFPNYCKYGYETYMNGQGNMWPFR